MDDGDALDPPVAAGGSGRRTLLLGVAVVLAVLAGVVVAEVATRDDGPQATPLPVGTDQSALLSERIAPGAQAPLPDLTLDGFADGQEVALAAYRGQPLVVNLWATWCAPCVEEMPDFQEVHEDLGEQVAFLGVNVQDSPVNAEPFAERLGITYDLAADPQGDLPEQVQAFGMPTTLFVDADGTIVFRHTGSLDVERLKGLLSQHLGVAA